jgi:transcriptional regulator with XRE-family HTH domain
MLLMRRHEKDEMSDNVVQLRKPRVAAPQPEVHDVDLWLRRIMMNGDGAGYLTANRLARKAGTTPTNITRFLSYGHPLPSLTTLNKIAHAVGVPPPSALLSSLGQPYVDVPVILPYLFRHAGVKRAMQLSVETTRAPARYAGCVAVKQTADTGGLAGVLLGDLVVVDHRVTPETNDLVMVALPDGTSGVYRLQGPWLVPQALGNLPSALAEDCVVMGVARQVQRELR